MVIRPDDYTTCVCVNGRGGAAARGGVAPGHLGRLLLRCEGGRADEHSRVAHSGPGGLYAQLTASHATGVAPSTRPRVGGSLRHFHHHDVLGGAHYGRRLGAVGQAQVGPCWRSYLARVSDP